MLQSTLAFRPASRRDACFLGPVGPSLNHRRRYYNPGVKSAASNVTTDRIRHINLLRKAMHAGEATCIQKQRERESQNYILNNCPTRCDCIQFITYLQTALHVSGVDTSHHERVVVRAPGDWCQ